MDKDKDEKNAKEERVSMPGEDYVILVNQGQVSGGACILCNFKANKVASVKNHITRMHKNPRKPKQKKLAKRNSSN